MVILRFLKYPPSSERTSEKQLGCGAHTDYGYLTLLAQVCLESIFLTAFRTKLEVFRSKTQKVNGLMRNQFQEQWSSIWG